MAVRSVQQILDAHEADQLAKARGILAGTKLESIGLEAMGGVYQSREHAPQRSAFNRRSGDKFARPVADHLAGIGAMTPHQRYEVAMERDIG